MEMWEGKGVNDVYSYAAQDIMNFGRKVRIDRPDAVDSHTLEMTPGIFHLSEPRKRLVTSYGRPVNVAFALAEVLHILAGRRDVEMLAHYNSTIGQFSDDGFVFNAAYGHRMRHAFGHDQIEDVIRTILDDRSSRQGTIVISNPVDDKGWNRVLTENPDDPTEMAYSKRQTKDRACNLVSHMLVRDDRLDWLQTIRSNDLIWGVPYNFMQFTHLQEYIATRVGAEVGNYHHTSHSLHIYSHHFEQAEAIRHFDLYTHHSWDHARMMCDDATLNTVLREEMALRERGVDHMYSREQMIDTVGQYWFVVLSVLQSWKQYTDGADVEALTTLFEMGDPVFAAAQARFYHENRWYKDEYEEIRKSMQDIFDVDEYVWMTTMTEA